MSSTSSQQQIFEFINSFSVITRIEATMTQEMPWSIWTKILFECVLECDEKKFLSGNQPEILLNTLIKWKSILDKHHQVPRDAVVAAENAINDFNFRCINKCK
jgi:hypothetical protein